MTSFALHGIGVSGGIAIGRAVLIAPRDAWRSPTTRSGRTRSTAEIERFGNAARRGSQRELEELRGARSPGSARRGGRLPRRASDDPARPDAVAGAARIIRERHCNAEWALSQQMEVLVAQFDEIEDAYLRERKADVEQVVERVLKRHARQAGARSSEHAAHEETHSSWSRTISRRRT